MMKMFGGSLFENNGGNLIVIVDGFDWFVF